MLEVIDPAATRRNEEIQEIGTTILSAYYQENPPRVDQEDMQVIMNARMETLRAGNSLSDYMAFRHVQEEMAADEDIQEIIVEHFAAQSLRYVMAMSEHFLAMAQERDQAEAIERQRRESGMFKLC